MNRCIALALFVLPLLALAHWAHRHAPPPPVYDRPQQHESEPLISFEAEERLVFEFEAPAAHIRGIWLQHLFTDSEAAVLIQIENKTRSQLLLREHIGSGHQHLARIRPTNQKGDLLSVSYQLVRSRKDQFPAVVEALKRSAHPPRYPVEMFRDGLSLAEEQPWPLFQLRFSTPLRHLMILWPGLLLGCAFLYIRVPSALQRWVFCGLISLTAAATSSIIWTRGYESDSSRTDPEGHLTYAEKLAVWPHLYESDPKEELSQWYSSYRHARFPLQPLLSAIIAQIRIPTTVGYLFLTGVFSFSTLLLMDYCLTKRLKTPPEIILLTLTGLGTHLAFTQSFLHPSPHAALTLLSLAACLTLGTRVQKKFSWQQEVAFGLLLLATALSYAPGVACALSGVVLAILLDLLRDRRLNLTAQARALEFYFVPPAVILALLYVGFNWAHASSQSMESPILTSPASPGFGLPAFLSTIFLLLILCPFLQFRDFRQADLFLLIAWGGMLCLASLFSSDDLRLRSYLPLLPVVFLLASRGLFRLRERSAMGALLVILSFASLNLWGVWFLLQQRLPLNSFAAGFLNW